MADYKLGVDQSSSPNSYKLYTDGNGGNLTEIATISGLELTSSTDPVDASAVGITVTSVEGETNKYTVTVGSNALATNPTTGTQVVSVTSSNGGSFTLALGSGVQEASTNYTAAPGTDSDAGKIFITAKHTAGWFVDSQEKSLKYSNGISNNTTIITVSSDNGALNTNLSANDYVFDATNKTVTLKKSAFGTLTKGSKVKISNTDFKLKLSSSGTDAVDVAGTLADTEFTWDTSTKEGTGDDQTVTAKLQKAVKSGWQETETEQTYTYQEQDPTVYATIKGLNKDTTAETLPQVAKEDDVTNASTAYDIALVKANFPTKDGSAVILTNGSAISTGNGPETVTPNFHLTKGADITDDPGTPNDANTIKLTLGEVSGDTRSASVVQTLKEGWALDTTDPTNANKKITYSTKKDVTLAEIAGLSKDASETTVTLGNDKKITLNVGALLADANKSVTLMQTAIDTLKQSNSAYADGANAYTLQLGSDVDNEENVGTGEYQLTVNSGTATVNEILERYWKVEENNNVASTKISFTAQRKSETDLAKIEGLNSSGAKYKKGASDNTVDFDSGAQTITLKYAALPNTTTNDTKVENKTENSAYKIKLDSDVDAHLLGATKGDPTVGTTTDSDGKVTVTVKPSDGWELTNNNTVTYKTGTDVTVAAITNLKASTNTADVVEIDKDTKTITLYAGALKETSTAEQQESASAQNAEVTLDNKKEAGYTDYTYKLALDTGVTKFDAGNHTPTLTVTEVAASDPNPATATAKITVTEKAGWELANDKLSVSFKKDNPVDVATITGLATAAANKENTAYSNVIFNTDTTSTDDDKIIKLKKAALRTGVASSYDVVLTPGTSTKYAVDYVLAIDDDVKAPATSYTVDGTTPIEISNGTASVMGTLSEGWVLNTTATDATKNRKLTYTPTTEKKALATITGLNTDTTKATTDTVALGTTAENPSTTEVNEYDKNVVYLQEAALTNSDVVLENKAAAADFSLKLKKDDDTSLTEFGSEKTHGWALTTNSNNTKTANYNEGTTEGWTLDTAADSKTKNLKVTYTAAVANNAADAKTLFSVTNLSKDVTLGKKDSDDNTAADSAVGTGADTGFKPGLWISTAYVAPVAADTQNNVAAVAEVKGKLTLNRNVLDTGDKELTIAISGTDKDKYSFVLANDKTNADTYIPTGERTKYIWTYNGSLGTATYKTASAKQWKPDSATNPTSLTYKPQTEKAVLAKISGLAKDSTNIKASDGEEFTTASFDLTEIKGGSLKKSDTEIVSVTKDYSAAVAAKEADAQADTPAVAAQDEVIGVITLKSDALTTGNVTFDSGSDKYGFALSGVTAPSLSENKWTTTATTATYTAKIGAGHSLAGVDSKNSAKSVNYTAANTAGATLATIAGLSGLEVLTDSNNAPTGITVDETAGTIELKDSVLGTSKVTIKNDTNIEYRLKLDDGVLDGSTEAEAKKIKDGIDVWRINKTTATYQHVIPQYYTLAEDGSNVTCTPENSKATYATLNGIKSGLKVNANGKIVTNEDDADTAALVTIEAGATADKPSTIKLKAGALATNALSLTNGSGQNYILGLGDGVTKVAITGTPSWKVANGTATLTGNTTAGWNVETGATPKAINYYPELTGKTLATITGLKPSITAISYVTETTVPTTTTGEFVLKTAALNGTDVTLTNDAFTDGTALKYTIKLDNSQPEAITGGDSRWYFDGTTKTTLHYGTVHDAHYEDSATQNGVYDGETAIKAQTIKYIAEKKDTPDFSIKNLASDLTLNDTDGDGYFKKTESTESNGPVKYTGTDGNDKNDGITINGNTVTMSKAVLSQDATAPTEIVNKDGVTTANRYKLKQGTDAKATTSGKEMLKLDGTKLTYYKGESDGFRTDATDKGNKITYVAAEPATDKNTIATINGLSSNLVQKDDKIGTVDATTKAFKEQVTRNNTEFTIKKGALDETNHTTIKIDGGTLVFGDDITNADKPQAAKNWVVGKTSGSYTYNSGTTAGWTAPNEGEHAGEIYYQPAAYDTVLVTLSDLKSGLKVGTVKVNNVDTPALLDKTDTAVTVNDSGGVITLTKFALNKKDAKLLNAKKDDGTLVVGTTGYKFATDQSKKADKPTENADTFVAESTAKGVWEKDKSKADKATYTVTITEGYKANNNAEQVVAGQTATYDARVVYTKADKAVATITGLSESTTVSNDTISGITVVNDQDKVQTGTIKVTPSALGKTDKATLSIKLSNSKSNYKLLFDGDLNTYEDGKAWNVAKNGTATYVQKYKANSYAQTSDTEITYTKDTSEKELVTVTGLAKLTADDKGVSEADAKTKYGIEAKTETRNVKSEDTESAQTTDKVFNVIEISDRTKLAASDVKLTNKNGSDYDFKVTSSDMTAGSTDDNKKVVDTNLGKITYDYANPLWDYNKGTVTLSKGDSGYWTKTQTAGTDTKNQTDDDRYTTLKYAKPNMKTVATIKGLSTELAVANNTVYATKTDGQGDNAKLVADTTKQVIALGSEESNVTPIKLEADAFISGNDNLKNNIKVTLALTNDGKYKLADGTNAVDKADEGTAEWSISKGTASYQYTTDAGWTFAADGKTVTYTTAKDTVLAKIAGLNKDLTTVVKDKDGNVTSSTKAPSDNIVGSTSFKYSDIIEVNNNLETDEGGTLVTFTLKKSDYDYLAGSKVTLTPVDKTEATYEIHADSALAPRTYDAEWDVDGKKGTATLSQGQDPGYSDATDKNAGKVVNYEKASVSTKIATITGLKKNTDADVTAKTTLEDLIKTDNSGGALVADTNAGTIALKDERILGTTTVTLGGKGGYTFDLSGVTNPSKIAVNTTPKLKANKGTVTLVEVTKKGDFALSSDSKKLVINTKKDTETVLATVKGLSKTLANYAGTDTNLKAEGTIVDTTTTGKGKDAVTDYKTTELVSYDNASGVITLQKDALANSSITFTLGKGVSKGDYTLQLASTVNTNTSDYKNKSAWTIKNGTASYKVKYNEGFYTKTDKGYTYTKETNGTVYATISGLKKTLTDTDIAAFNTATTTNGTSAAITLKKDLLDEKNVTLSNKKVGGSTATNFTLALDTNGMTTDQISTLGGFEWKGGKLTADQSTGYLKASDTQITYLKKIKENQAVATITGLSKDATIARKPTKADDNLEIVLNKADLAGKNVTITTTNLTTGNYTLKLGNDAPKSTITANANADDPWSVKSGTATYSGYMTEGYKETAGGKTITYTKAAGSALVPATDTKKEKPAVYKALTTIKGVTESTAPKSTNTTLTAGGGTVTLLDANNVTLGSGLFDVNYGGTNITGSKDADTIKLSNTGSVTVNGAKGDDSIDLGSATATIVYANGDGYDVIKNFGNKNTANTISIPKSVISASDVKVKDNNTYITVGKGTIQLTGYTGEVSITDKNGKHSYGGSASDLLADDNYSMDAASLSDIVEPFKASYTPYDFETGLDLVKKDSFAPALTFTGTSDKK